MKTVSWKAIKDLIGEDMAMFCVFMATVQANEILGGFSKVVKGAKYLSDDTIESMYKDLVFGICRETLENHIHHDLLSIHEADDSVFARGIDDLESWLQLTSAQETNDYFQYLSRWDLDGHNWVIDRPSSFSDFIR